MEIHQQLCLSGSVCTSPPGTHYIFQLFELVKKNSKQTVWKNMCVCALHSCIPPNNGCLFFFFFFFCLYPGQKNAAQLWCAGKTKFIHEEHDNHTVEEQRRCWNGNYSRTVMGCCTSLVPRRLGGGETQMDALALIAGWLTAPVSVCV